MESAMAIDWNTEEIICLAEASNRLLEITKRKVHPSTIWRWCHQGLGGVKLEFINVGVKTFTSIEGLQRFCIALAQLNRDIPKTFSSKRRRIKTTKRAPQHQREIDSAKIILIRAKILQDAKQELASI
jgi:hypothetical protein